MEILGSFLPRNYFTFYRNNIVFGIKLQLRSFSVKRYYSFRPIASYRDARGEETNAHTHAHLFLLKLFVALSEIACRLPGFQRGKDRITIIDKCIGVSSPGNITSMGYQMIRPKTEQENQVNVPIRRKMHIIKLSIASVM